ncbi:MAG TPA: ComF family protein [Plantibacter sp.]|uniref:ComF family protein n=1 Tax=unclassified Plantibacter TaxID=2624265 RepID=UPI002CDD3F37|nr:ComF family protein [Plantibacter sp.]
MSEDPRPPTLARLTADAVLDAWAVLVPVSCAACGAPDRELCATCRHRLISSPDAPEGVRWTFPDGTPGAATRRYDRLTASVLLAYKQEARIGLLRPLAAAMRPAFETVLAEAEAEAEAGAEVEGTGGRHGPAVEVATVPARRRAAMDRGFHPLELLVRRLGARPARPLCWAREPADQRDFGRIDRFSNLAGALVARADLAHRRFLLVEDVVTTGATAQEAARAIRAGGGTVSAVVALARVLP